MERNRTAHNGQGTACHNGTVVILFHIVFGKINGLSSCGICCHEFKLGRIFHDGRIIDRVSSIGVGQCLINILKTEKLSGAQQIFDTHITGLMQMVYVKSKVSSALSGKIACHICRSGRYADAVIECNVFI